MRFAFALFQRRYFPANRFGPPIAQRSSPAGLEDLGALVRARERDHQGRPELLSLIVTLSIAQCVDKVHLAEQLPNCLRGRDGMGFPLLEQAAQVEGIKRALGSARR